MSLSGDGLDFEVGHGGAQGCGLHGFAQHVNVMDRGLVRHGKGPVGGDENCRNGTPRPCGAIH